MSVLMRSVSGIRGIVGPAFSPSLVVNYVNAFVQLTGARKVVIGRDTRTTGPMIENLVASACAASGAEAVILGVASTPTVEMAVLEHKAGGGIIITASHNPIEWNALKFLTAEGIFLDEGQVKSAFRAGGQQPLRLEGLPTGHARYPPGERRRRTPYRRHPGPALHPARTHPQAEVPRGLRRRERRRQPHRPPPAQGPGLRSRSHQRGAERHLPARRRAHAREPGPARRSW